ncbi:sensor histidine kinase [Paenibacillus solisilvae]|uniref:histidine kinase n=1 Tax=Paenibacillus solisilvae TaxID=2486751 RepID=A0ABW0VQX7_9BACL
MELWTVGNKMVLLFYVIAVSYITVSQPSPWLVLYILIYISLNLTVHIVKNYAVKQGIIVLIIIFLIVCSISESPYFILLLPLSSYEMASFYEERQRFVILPLMIPLLFMPPSMMVFYAFIAVLSFFNFMLIRRYMARMNKQEDQIERMRSSQQQLSRKLNENHEFIRTSEYMVKLEERNRLAQEIHDGIGHSMTGALIQMEAAKRLLTEDPDAAAQLLQNAIGISKEGIEEIRLTLKNMKPPVEQLGFSRLKAAVDNFGVQSGLLTTVVHEGNMEIITPIQWKIIHENIIESLTNAAKYANASSVHVEVRVLNRFIKAVVSDNGQGAAKIVKGLGLIGMEERTAAVNGTVIADGDQGFIVTTLIPYGGT